MSSLNFSLFDFVLFRESLEEAEAVQQATFTDSDKYQTLMEKVRHSEIFLFKK